MRVFLVFLVPVVALVLYRVWLWWKVRQWVRRQTLRGPNLRLIAEYQYGIVSEPGESDASIRARCKAKLDQVKR